MTYPKILDPAKELHKEQHYIISLAETLGYEYTLWEHQRETISCEDKLDLLLESPQFKNFKLKNIWKAMYFGRKDNPLIGIVAPGDIHKINPRKLLTKEIIGEDISQRGRYWPNPENMPPHMKFGTSSPFLLTSSFGKDKKVKHIIVYSSNNLKEYVDISIGGIKKDSYRRSMHIPAKAILEILTLQFGTKRVHLYDQNYLKTLL